MKLGADGAVRVARIAFNKIGIPGRRSLYMVEALVRFDGTVLSISADVWNSHHTDVIMGGQCLDTINDNYRNQLKARGLWDEVHDLWAHWHLNDIRSGTPEQDAAVDDYKREFNDPYLDNWDAMVSYLKTRRLYEVPDPENPGKTFAYGDRWIMRRIPDDVRKRIDAIMDKYCDPDGKTRTAEP